MSHDILDSYLSLGNTQYAQAPIGTTRIASKGDGVDFHGTVPAWIATSWEIEFDVVFPITLPTAAGYTLDSVDGSTSRIVLFVAITTGRFNFSGSNGTPVVTLDGVTLTNNTTAHPLDGAVHHVKITGSFAINLTQLLRRGNNTSFFAGAIFNLSLKDLSNAANCSFYAMAETIASSVIVDTGARAQNGTWVNRVSGDVVTVYPDAIKPAEAAFLAIRFEATGGVDNPYLFTLGTVANPGRAIIGVLSNANGGLDLYRVINGATVGSLIPAKDFGASFVDGNVHTLVMHKSSATQVIPYVDSGTALTTITGTAFTVAIDTLTLNARWDGATTRKGSVNIHYAYLYSALSGADITALMAGGNPENVGTIRQGYNMLRNGDEVNGGPALALYGSPTFVVPMLHDKIQRAVASITRSPIRSPIRLPVN